jgi:hypothetical protein
LAFVNRFKVESGLKNKKQPTTQVEVKTLLNRVQPFAGSDMWQPYLAVMAKQAGHALHILDRFHIVQNLNKAVDQVRRAESTRLRGQPLAAKLKKMRWKLLRRGTRVRGQARLKLEGLLQSKLATGRAWLLKESFEHFWTYKSFIWAGAFLDYWTRRAMRSRIEPMKRVARMLRKHEKLLLNWFKAKGEVSSGAVEGLNNKIRVVTRRSYGFRTYKAMETALYHNLGRLPEPESTHRNRSPAITPHPAGPLLGPAQVQSPQIGPDPRVGRCRVQLRHQVPPVIGKGNIRTETQLDPLWV